MRLRPSAGQRSVKVRRTLLLNLGLIGLVFASLLFVLLGATIKRSFGALEQREIQNHVGRVTDFERSTLRSIAARAKDWAIWDDSYLFAQDFNAAYVAANITATSFQNALVDGLVYFRYKDGATRSYFFDRKTGEKLPGRAEALRRLVVASALRSRVAKEDAVQTFVSLDGRLYALGAVRLRRSDGSGEAQALLAFVQEIDSERASRTLQVDAVVDLKARPQRTAILIRPETVVIDAPLAGIDRQPVGSIRLTLKRPLVMAARELMTVTFAGVLVVMLVMLALLSRRIRTLILEPIERLHAHVGTIRTTGELRPLEGPKLANELGALQAEFNSMTAELQDLRAKIESQSFLLGKSQSAIGLMHNLRNCLAPVRVILETLEREAGDALPPQAPRALEELAGAAIDPVRREKLVAFLAAAHEQIGARNAAQRHHVREAARNLMNALAAIDTVQQDRSETRFDERCDISALLSHAGNIVRFADGRDLAVDTHTDARVVARGNRVLLSQVLENIVMNAVEAIREIGRTDGLILLRATQDEATGLCRIVVTDNGGGFEEDVAKHLFERNFSTRTSKSGGLGLHWCANTVKAMSGALTLDSAGTGLGARATIILPLWQDQSAGLSSAA